MHDAKHSAERRICYKAQAQHCTITAQLKPLIVVILCMEALMIFTTVALQRKALALKTELALLNDVSLAYHVELV